MAVIPFFLYKTGAGASTAQGGYRSMLAFWTGGATAVSPTTITPPPLRPPVDAGGVGYGPAFPRRPIRDLYRQLPEQPHVEVDAPRIEPTPAQLSAPSPLPILMDFGMGPVALGIRAPSLRDALHEQILADDEDAIIAILLAVT